MPRAPLNIREVYRRFPDKTPHVETSGQRGGWNKALHKPAPDSVYVVDGRDVYVTDHLGRVEHVEGRWDPTAAADAAEHRNGHQQRVAGRADRQPGDVGAHLIAASGGGGGEGLNLVALRDAINAAGGDYGKMEREIRRLVAQDPDALIEMRINLGYPGSSRRPDQIDIDVLADGHMVGKVDITQ